MSQDRIVVEATPPPLSHLQESQDTQSHTARNVLLSVAAVVALAGLFWVFTIAPDELASKPVAVDQATTPPTQDSTTSRRRNEEVAAPFAQLQFEREREAAQEQLSVFVELQIQLEESMQVGEWGEAQYRAAKDVASLGDKAFLEERFVDATKHYDDAEQALVALIAEGEALYAASLSEGGDALANFDVASAKAAFANALLIKPDSVEAGAGQQRAERLPEVIELLRTATNHELANRWQEALSTYDQVAQIDPLTSGLAARKAEASEALSQEQLRTLLSQGFAALDNGQFSRARQAFRQAQALDPGNKVAAGGLQQVGAKSDLSIIARKRTDAENAERREDWNAAATLYAEVLELDANIQFARDGRERMSAHINAVELLTRIKGSPEKLSSPKLFSDARSIVSRARDLSPSGVKLKALTAEVAALLDLYDQPVAVTFLSDAATDITLSSVGRLGKFANKRMDLRPGEYTVVGSQDGCRDIRQSIIVKPNMPPVTVRCSELITQ